MTDYSTHKWTEADHARWDRACGVSEKEIARRQEKRRKLKEKADALVNPYENVCDHCGKTFISKFSYKYCGNIRGCLNDESGETRKEMDELLSNWSK
jgi:ribosomal protein L32